MEKVLTFFSDVASLIRVKQWYKNLVVFLPIFFIVEFLNLDLLALTLLGFLSLCLVSSSGYLINDMVDLKKDQLNPEKINRPLASGKISRLSAGVMSLILLLCSLVLAALLGRPFFLVILGVFVLGQIYTFWLKKVLFADIIAIAILFVARAISGALIINASISPWLILCPFFLSLFLGVGKRHSEAAFLREKAKETREVLQDYSSELTNSLMIISTTLLICSYALYSFLSEHKYLLITLPFALFVVFRFFYFIISNSEIARHPEKIIKDKPILAGIMLWIVLTAYLIYGL